MKTTLALCLVAALLVGFASDASSQVLVGRWQFEEGSGTNTVNSVNSVNAVLEGGASFGTLTDPFGGSNTVALGTGRYVDTMQGASDLLPTTGSYSISAWGYITNAASENWTLVGAADNVPPTQGNSVINGHASLNLARGEVWGPNASPYVPTPWQGGIANNAWNNFVLVNDSAAKTVTIFVNGVASEPTAYSGTPFTNPVGAWIFGGNTFFQGEIADVQFYTGVLSPAQIKDVIMQGNAVATETNDYSGWLANYPSLTGANTNGTADPDGDGFVNNAEFSFGGDPTVGTPALMTVIRSGANAVFNWIERTNGVMMFDVTNPARGDVICQLPNLGRAEAARASVACSCGRQVSKRLRAGASWARAAIRSSTSRLCCASRWARGQSSISAQAMARCLNCAISAASTATPSASTSASGCPWNHASAVSARRKSPPSGRPSASS